MKTFSEKFEQNANLQLRKVTRAIDLYVKNVYIKSRLVRYVNSQNGFGMMQPLIIYGASRDAILLGDLGNRCAIGNEHFYFLNLFGG